eukprot:TRINITY_DN6291_c0_g2_i1.p1 TRINITY_DN6291_c0_g2~~TRINITY_DN6291_c0_g2_i1.p1  ORF type:complete len:149 (+),score=24.86 TRINITY_DN6291_c0_g2_i1:244-690(+)
MKPDWDKLGMIYMDSPSVLIAAVDCSSDDSRSICQEAGVSEYPTLRYFTQETGRSGSHYSGGRDLQSLQTFVKQTLERHCNPDTKAGCDSREVAYVRKMSSRERSVAEGELRRLESLRASDLKLEGRVWLAKRAAILRQLLRRANGEL